MGGFVTQHNGWKWSQYTLAIIVVAAYVPVFFLQETYLKIILTKRKEKQHAAANPQTKPPALALLLGVFFITLLRPMKILLTEPIVTFLSLYVAFNFAILFTFFGSIPYVFESVYHFNRSETGLVFLAIGLGCTISIPTLVILDKLIYQKEHQRRSRERESGVVAPERRLWAAMLGAFGLPVGLFWYESLWLLSWKNVTDHSDWFSWSSRSDVHWIVPILAIVPYGWGNLCIYVCGQCHPVTSGFN
jgi:hypothetical protein